MRGVASCPECKGSGEVRLGPGQVYTCQLSAERASAVRGPTALERMLEKADHAEELSGFEARALCQSLALHLRAEMGKPKEAAAQVAAPANHIDMIRQWSRRQATLAQDLEKSGQSSIHRTFAADILMELSNTLTATAPQVITDAEHAANVRIVMGLREAVSDYNCTRPFGVTPMVLLISRVKDLLK